MGGGERPPEMMRRFVELAGGKGAARIAVFPMASGEAEATGAELVEEFRSLGADAWSLDWSRDRAAADSAARALDAASGIWFCGGDQSRVMDVLEGTPGARAIRERHAAGVVVGGTSAGAAVMSDPMITGDERRPGGDEPDTENPFLTIERGDVVTRPGLGLLPGAIVDQHFVRRKRHNRLLSLVLENPALLGVGIDESTVLEVQPDGEWQVRGAGAVVVYDARGARVVRPGAHQLAATEVRLHVLTSGSRFDPRRGRARLPAP